MSRRKAGSGVGYKSRRMSVEQLEGRSLLAGVVSAFVSGGSLFIQGDNTDNAVIVQDQGDGNYTVTGFDFGDIPELAGFKAGPTTINGGQDVGGGTKLFTGVTNDINIDLKKGNDALAIGNSVDELQGLAEQAFGIGSGMGGGSSSVSPNEIVIDDSLFQVPRNLIVNTGDGNDYVVVNANVGSANFGGVASINTGNGNDGVAFGRPFASDAPSISEESAQLNEVFDGNAYVANSLVILTGNGDDDVSVTRTTVQNQLNVQTGAGNDEFRADQFAAGNAVVTSAAGDDFISLVFFALDSVLVVDTGAGGDDLTVADFSMGHGEGPASQSGAGYATIVTGAGDDGVVMFDFEADGVYINTGAGNDGVAFEDVEAPARVSAQQVVVTDPISVGFADITNTLTVVTGAGNDFVEIYFVAAHDIVVDTGAGNDGSASSPVVIYNVQVAGSLTAVTGAGNDFLYIDSDFRGEGQENDSFIAVNLVVDMGAGNDNVEIIDQQVGNDMVVALGPGTNNAAIGVGGEFDGISEGTLSVGRNLTVVGGAGKDTIEMGNLDVHNNLFAILGAGNDSLFLSGATIGNNATVDAGAGNDDVTVEDAQITGTATALMGAGNDSLTITTSAAKKLVARGGAGKDTLASDLGITGNGTTANSDVSQFETFVIII